MRLLAAAVACAFCVLPASAAVVPPVSGAQSFRLPSRNIACAHTFVSPGPATLRCDLLSGLRPEPQRTCRFDWVGVTLSQRGAGRPLCGSDTVYDQRAPILGYGKRWARAGFRCHSQRMGLRCTNAFGHGFFLSRERWRVF